MVIQYGNPYQLISTLLQTYFTIAFLIQIDTWTGSRFGDSKGFSHSIWLAIVDMLQGYGSDYVLLWREDLQTSLFLAMSKQRGVYVVSFLCRVRFVVDHFNLIWFQMMMTVFLSVILFGCILIIYCWWLKSCSSWYLVYPVDCRLFHILDSP